MSFFPYAEESLLALDEAAVSSFRALVNNCDVAALTSAIARLEAREQLVLALIHFEEFGIAEEARILDTSAFETGHLHALAVLALHKSYLGGESIPAAKNEHVVIDFLEGRWSSGAGQGCEAHAGRE